MEFYENRKTTLCLGVAIDLVFGFPVYRQSGNTVGKILASRLDREALEKIKDGIAFVEVVIDYNIVSH